MGKFYHANSISQGLPKTQQISNTNYRNVVELLDENSCLGVFPISLIVRFCNNRKPEFGFVGINFQTQ